jgi:hypothetical protein
MVVPSSNFLGCEPGDHMCELMCAYSRAEVRTVPRFQAIRACRMRAANLALRLLVVSLLLPAISSAQPNPVRRVLVFHELGLSSPTVGLVDHELRDALANAPYQIELYHEYLETILFPDPVVQQNPRRCPKRSRSVSIGCCRKPSRNAVKHSGSRHFQLSRSI